jgi:hypothetical protein
MNRRRIIDQGVRPIMWGFKDSDCPQENDIFTYEPFANLAPASIIKLFWEYNDGVIVESCHDVNQFNTFLRSRMGAVLDPNVQLPVNDAQMRAAQERQVFLESSTLALLLAYLVRKRILPPQVGAIAETVGSWQQSFVRWNTIEGAREINEANERNIPRFVRERDPLAYARRAETYTEMLTGLVAYSKLLHVGYSYVAALIAYVNEGARSRGHAEITWSNPDLLIPILAFVVVLAFEIYGLDVANKILKSVRDWTGIPLPSAEALLATYVTTQSLGNSTNR